jgi:hypothetical protein
MGNRSMEGCPLVKYLRQSESRKRQKVLKIHKAWIPRKGKHLLGINESIPLSLSRPMSNLSRRIFL